jgi:hypothetical protein
MASDQSLKALCYRCRAEMIYVTSLPHPPSTTTARTINNGVFIASLALQAPRPSKFNRGSNEPKVNAWAPSAAHDHIQFSSARS